MTKTDKEIITKWAELRYKLQLGVYDLGVSEMEKQAAIRLYREAQDEDELRKNGWIRDTDWSDVAPKYIRGNVIPSKTRQALKEAIKSPIPNILTLLAQEAGWTKGENKPARSEEFINWLKERKNLLDESYKEAFDKKIDTLFRQGQISAFEAIEHKYLATHTERASNPPSIFDIEHTKHNWVHDKDKNEDICSKCGEIKREEESVAKRGELVSETPSARNGSLPTTPSIPELVLEAAEAVRADERRKIEANAASRKGRDKQ